MAIVNDCINGSLVNDMNTHIHTHTHFQYFDLAAWFYDAISDFFVVECTGARSEFSACAGGHHCLELNGQSYCLPSCFVDNGGCREDQYCVTQPMEYSECSFGLEVCSTVRCIDKDGRFAVFRNSDIYQTAWIECVLL